MVILQHSFANCSRLLRCQCTGCLAALLPTPSHGSSGISTARARVKTYAVKLISCTLVSEPGINMMEPTMCWNLGQSLSWGLLRCRGQQPGGGSTAHTEHVVLPGASGEDDKHGASLKIEGRKNIPLQDPRDFMVIDLPFHSHEEFIRIIT